MGVLKGAKTEKEARSGALGVGAVIGGAGTKSIESLGVIGG